MAKKKETAKSVALFGEDDVNISKSTKSVVKKTAKTTKSSSKSDSKSKKDKLSSKEKSSKKDKEIKKNETVNKSTKSSSTKSSTRKTSDTKKSRSTRISSSNTVSNSKTDKNKKNTGVSSRTSQRGLQNTAEKSKCAAKRDKQVVSSTAKNTRDIKQSSNSRTKASRIDKELDQSANSRTAVKDNDISIKSKDSGRKEQEAGSYIVKLRAEAKKIRKAGKYQPVNRVSAPQTIEWGPNPVKDDDSIVEIIVNKQMKYVSPWSVKDGVYYEGLDSEFLVNRLRYQAEEEDKDLEAFNFALKTKYKTWDAASTHKNIPEDLVFKYGSKLSWLTLAKYNDVKKYSKKVQKKYSIQFAAITVLKN